MAINLGKIDTFGGMKLNVRKNSTIVEKRKTSDDYLKQYGIEWNAHQEEQKKKNWLYNLYGGNIWEENDFKKNNEAYQNYLKALEEEKKEKNVSQKMTDYVTNIQLTKPSEAFEDGYQFGDVSKTIGSTALDVSTQVVKGAFGLGESIGDLGQYAVAQGADWLGQKDFADQLRENARYNATEAIFNPAEEMYGKNSVAGQTTKDVSHGVGYVLGMGAGGTLLPTKFQTLNVGKFKLPTTSLVSGMGNSMTEAYEQGANDAEAWGYGALGGLSEAFSESLFGGLGKKFEKVYGKGALDDVLIKNLTKKIENTAMRTIAQSGLKAVGEGAEEVISGLGSALAKKLTYANDEDFKKILEDENLLDQFVMGALTSAVMQVPSTVSSVKSGKDYVNTNSDEPVSVYEAVEEDNTKNSLSENRLPIIDQNGNVTNYNKFQYIQSDNSKIDNLRKSANQYLNNSNEAKNLVDTIEKVISDKDYNVVFDNTITNKNGQSVNAQINTNKNGEIEIKINPNSPRAGEFLLVHEITHAIETDNMKQLVMDFASKNPEFNTALESLKQTYGTDDVSSEVVADISGQLLGNQEFINSLSMEQPSVFRKIYNKIIELANKITGNSNEALFVRDLRNKWENAYRSTANEQAVSNLNGNAIFSIQIDTNGNRYVNVDTDQDIFEGINPKDYNKIAKMYINDYLRGTTRLADSSQVVIDSKSVRKYTNPGKRQSNFTEKMKLTPELKNALEISEKTQVALPSKDTSKYRSWEYYKFNFKLNNQNFSGIINIGIDSQGNRHFYEINNIKKTSGISETSPNRPTGFSENNIPQSNNKVKSGISTKYSMQENQNNTPLDKSIRRYDDLSKTNYIEYFRTDNGDVRVSLIDSNNNLVNQLDLWSNTEAIKQFGERLGNQLYNYATDNNQKINIGNDINNLGLETDYFMNHRPTQTGLTADDLINQNVETPMPKDIYNHPEYYFQMNEKSSQESMSVLRKVRGNPNAEITIYRATPGNKINEGDWITLSKTYAEWHNQSQFDGKANILEMKVRAKDVQYAGDDINEFGYFPDGNIKNSISNESWQDYLEKNYKATGTRTEMRKLLPTQEDIERAENNNTKLPKKVLNPLEISQLSPEDANTTPILPNVRRNTSNDGESSFANNIQDKTNMLTEDQKNTILSDEEVRYYDKITNKDSLEEAFTRLAENGQNETLNWFSKDSDKATATDVAEGWILLKQYADNNDSDGMVAVAKKLRDMGTKAGQTVQAFNIMSRLTPEGMVKYAQSELSEAYDRMVKGKTKKWIDQHQKDFDLTPQETGAIMEIMKKVSIMEDGYDKRVELAKIQKIMTDKLPPERGAGMKAWMRISMLFNAKTQVRNIAGNAIIAPVNSFGDLFASMADKLVGSKTGYRTTGITNIKNYVKGFKEGAYQSYNDFKKGINTRNIQGNRFEIGEGKSFNDQKVIGKALNKVDSLLSFMLDVGDRTFYEATFTNSINNQLVLNNTTEVTQDMIDIATQEALSRTWQDNNNYTRFVLNVRKMLNNVNVNGYGLGDTLIPFAKTPANLTKAIVDYSPAGVISTLVKGKKLSNAIKTGQFTPRMQHEFVQSLGKATAGTMLYVLGYALAKAGIVSGESDEDKDVRDFMKNTLGINSYSIKIGDKSFTYDWAQPIAAPLSIMANIVQKDKEDASTLEKIVSSLDTAGNILLEQSFMESINTALSNNDGLATGIEEAILDLPARAVPTFMKQIVDLTDSTQRTSFEYDKPLESMINSVKAKIPGLSQTLAPSVDTMGREIQRYGGKNNIFNVFLNPANVSVENISESAGEIYRLYKETGDATIMPRVAPYYINQGGSKITLSASEKSKFQRISGQIIEDNVNDLLDNDIYNAMSDGDKAMIINKIVNFSYNKAREEVLNIPMSNEYNKINMYISDGGTPNDYYINKEEIDYSYENPAKYSTITQITTYAKYQNYNDAIKNIKEQYEDSTQRKYGVINYVNGLNLSIPQKAMLIKMNYKSFNSYDNQIIEYINSQNMTVAEKTEILEQLGFTVRNGKVYS